MPDTSDSESDQEIDTCAALEQWVALLLSRSPRKRMIISDLGLQITETFDKSIKSLTGMTTTAFFDRMKKKKVIDIESDSGKYGSFNVVVLRNTAIIKEIASDSSSAEDANSENADSEHLKPSKKRKISKQSDQPTKKRKLNDSIENESDRTKQRHKGVVRLFLSSKGYGFIKWNGDDKDLWFHANDSQKENERAPFISGDAVEFEIITNRGKDTAINVVLDPDRVIPKFRGKCIQWDEVKAFGFIQRDDGGDDVFVHHRNLIDEESLKEGDRAEFEVITDHKTGKSRAVRVRKIEEENEEMNLDAKDEASDISEDPIKERHKGEIDRFLNRKGYGFIKWDGGEDLWFHVNDSQKENERVRFYDGDAVFFEIGTGNRGKNHKVAINVVLDPDREPQRSTGTCISFNVERGFGFIQRDDDGDTVFVHSDSILDGDALKIGDRIQFELITDSKSGNLQAVRVEADDVNSDYGPPATDELNQSQKRKISDAIEPLTKKQKVTGSDDEEEAQSEEEEEEEEEEDDDDSENAESAEAVEDDVEDDQMEDTKERHKGVVKLFSKSKRYGFIKWGQGKELWFHANDSQKPNERVTFITGDVVEFEIGTNRGQEAAINVVLDPDHETPKVRGECMRWNEEKGFGFIQRDDDGEDVFVHYDSLIDESTLREGDRVEFVVIEHHKTGKSRAVRVKKIEEESDDSTDSVNKMNINAKDEASDSSEITTKERHKGEIGLFLNNKGYGFIKWDGGEDLWFHIDDSRKENGPKPQFYKGEAVFFEIGVGRKGDDVAVNVVLDPDRELQISTGKCISWNEYKAFGFIQTDDGEDVFVHSKGILDGDALDEGERLQFELITNPKSGKLQAVRVEAEDKDSEYGESKKRKISDAIEPPTKKQKVTGSEDEDEAQSEEEEEEEENDDTSENAESAEVVDDQMEDTKERHKGVVTLFSKSKGYGFIKWNGGESLWFDVKDSPKVDKSEIKIQSGDAVEFELGTGKQGIDGKVAINVELDSDQEAPPSVRGECVKWIEKRGFGFIKPDGDTPFEESVDNIYFHRDSIIDSHSPKEGDRVEFHVVKGPKGKLRAEGVKREEEEEEEEAPTTDTIDTLKGEMSDSSENIEDAKPGSPQKGVVAMHRNVQKYDSIKEAFEAGKKAKSEKLRALKAQRMEEEAEEEDEGKKKSFEESQIEEESRVVVKVIKMRGKGSKARMKRIMAKLKGSLKHHTLHCHTVEKSVRSK